MNTRDEPRRCIHGRTEKQACAACGQRVTPMPTDPETLDVLRTAAVAVVKQAEPDEDGDGLYAEYLVPADAIARLLAIRAQVKALETEDGELVNALKFSMAGGARLFAPRVGRITWTAPAERRTTAWKDVVAEFRAQLLADGFTEAIEVLDECERTHTTVAEGLRTFRVTPAKPAPEEESAA